MRPSSRIPRINDEDDDDDKEEKRERERGRERKIGAKGDNHMQDAPAFRPIIRDRRYLVAFRTWRGTSCRCNYLYASHIYTWSGWIARGFTRRISRRFPHHTTPKGILLTWTGSWTGTKLFLHYQPVCFFSHRCFILRSRILSATSFYRGSSGSRC